MSSGKAFLDYLTWGRCRWTSAGPQLVCVECWVTQLENHTRLLEPESWCWKIWKSPAKRCLHDRITRTTRNALSSILAAFTVADKHDVLLKQHNTYILIMFLMGTSPKLRFHMLHQGNPDCCRRLAAGFLERNRPHELWSHNEHYFMFLHLSSGTCPTPDNLNKCCALVLQG